VYDGAGNKLSKTTTDNSQPGKAITTSTTHYITGFVYESKATVPANTPAMITSRNCCLRGMKKAAYATTA
jgi:hypothetical protein